MKALSALILLPLFAAPALADGGAHLHPHGGESWLALTAMGILVVAVVALRARVLAVGRKPRK